MEIVEAESVREAMFDADTGKPIREAQSGPTPARSKAANPDPGKNLPNDANINMTGEQSSPSPDDFPIKFD